MGASLSFNGSSDFGRLGSAVVSDAPVTLACWANVTTIAATITAMCVGSSADASRLALGISATTGVVHMHTDSGASNAAANSATGVTINTWQHIAGTSSGSASRFAWRNGVAGSENVTSRTPVSLSRTSIGVRDTATQANWTPGLIAHAAIWNAVLTTEEILALAKGWNPLRIRRSALVFYAPCLNGGHNYFGTAPTLTGTTASADGPPCQLP